MIRFQRSGEARIQGAPPRAGHFQSAIWRSVPGALFREGGLMASHCNDLTVDQLLNDPMTLAVMRADGVDPVSFKTMLAGQAARLREARGAAAIFGSHSPFSVSRAPAFIAAGPYDSCRAF
jgi:hypothetical protein